MDSDEDAPPPPPPSSPPPGEEESVPKSTSDKFKALQSMLSSASTMYTPLKDKPSIEPAPPPSKRAHIRQDSSRDSPADDSSQLTHATKDRPRRKVRPPSRKGRLEGQGEVNHLLQETEEATLTAEALPDLPPPPPPFSELPTEITSGISMACRWIIFSKPSEYYDTFNMCVCVCV